MTSNTTLWITTAVMLLGGLLILAVGTRRTTANGPRTVLHGTVPIIAPCSCLAMAAGQAAPIRASHFARYIDWTFTTPLLLVSLGLEAWLGRRDARRPVALRMAHPV